MAEGLNKVMLLGNLGADPELRFTQGATAVLNLRLACSESYLDRNREKQERTEWVNVVIWGKRAEALSKFLRKGSRIFVEGGLRTSSYEDRDGNERRKTEVNATNIILAGGKREREEGDSGAGRGGSRGGGGSSRGDYGGQDDDGGSSDFTGPTPGDDDIPF
jgi:single-strand DNA-binding protein